MLARIKSEKDHFKNTCKSKNEAFCWVEMELHGAYLREQYEESEDSPGNYDNYTN